MQDTTKLMMKLIISNFGIDITLPSSIDESELKQLYALSTKHDLAHIVASALEKHDLLNVEGAKKAFSKQKMIAVYRRAQLDFEEQRLYAVLENAGIDFLPLKGAVVKSLYPENWMRTSCDIDILVREDNLDSAVSAIKNELGYTDKGRHFHEHSLLSKSNVHLELHFNITENIETLDKLLERVWEYARPISDGSRRHLLTNEYFIFHNVAHMQYHFVAGGCGIRPFIDLWLMLNQLDYDKNALQMLLNESKSEEFYANLLKLINVWFENGSHTELTEKMEEYILTGGVFGSRVNRAAVDREHKGSKSTYIISRIFMPKKELESIYPNLKKRPYLLPFYEIKRWFRLLGKKGRSNMKAEIIANKQLGEAQNGVPEMLKELGL